MCCKLQGLSAAVCHCPVMQIYGASSKICKIAPLLSFCLLCLQGLRACAAGAEPAELLIRCESVCLQLLAPLKWLHVSRCLCFGSVCTHKCWPLEVAAAIHTPPFCVHHPTSAGRNAEAAPVFMLSVVVLLQVGCDAQPQAGGTHGTLRWLRFTPLMAALRCIHRKHCLRRHILAPHMLAATLLDHNAISLPVTSLSVPCRMRTTWATSPLI